MSLFKTDEEAATDLTMLLMEIFNKNESLQKSPLYIVAESYGGKFAATLGLSALKAIESGKLKLILGGVALGDSWISPEDFVFSWGPLLKDVSRLDSNGAQKSNSLAQQMKQQIDNGQFEDTTNSWSALEGVISSDELHCRVFCTQNIEFVVSPYEADARLAYLSSLEAEKGGIVAVISEDSDLLAYGCPTVVFKMDRYGNGEEIVQNKVFESASCVPSFQCLIKNFSQIHLSSSFLIGMCVLAGCDFLPSVPGIGITKAYSLVSKYRNLDRYLLKVRRDLRLLQSAHIEEIVSSSFQVIHGTKPKQKVQLLESTAKAREHKKLRVCVDSAMELMNEVHCKRG
ncbi:Serine carboxypeptidase-like 51 [Camellia lanceoleosa]|uniref:Serine carboxypeptidase-like 51 n=1 Tax=Camellia lanceoleosa TaxID=1840588 RepID=A0ACC0FM29_9ERIC|nr:Serine carboxypeptidase-like 51 [Camellia lanceoleosa]